MFRMKILCSVLILAALIDSGLLYAAEQRGIISRVSDASSSYCFLRFPAIQEDTLYWQQPVLKDPSSSDIVSFYGPCDYDPLGRSEILRQRAEYQRKLQRLFDGPAH